MQKKEFTGEIGNLSPKQQQVLDELKNHITKMQFNKPIYDDWYLLRFCRPHDFKLDKIKKAFETFHKIREHNKVDRILQYDLAEFEKKLLEIIPSGYTGWDKFGRPLKYVQILKADPKQFEAQKDGYALLTGFKYYEYVIHVLFPYMTALTKQRIDRETTVLDFGCIKDLPTLLKDEKIKKYMKIFSDIAKDCYPEIGGKVFVINCPPVMKTFWPFISSFVNEKNKENIILLGNNYHESLFKYVDKKYIPDFAGGEVKDWPNVKLPWNDYLNYCIEKKTFFHDVSMQIGDPLLAIKKNPFDRKKIEEFLKNKQQPTKAVAPQQAKPVAKKPEQTNGVPKQQQQQTEEAPKKQEQAKEAPKK